MSGTESFTGPPEEVLEIQKLHAEEIMFNNSHFFHYCSIETRNN